MDSTYTPIPPKSPALSLLRQEVPSPGLWHALGLIVLYFLLQLAASFAVALVLGLGLGLQTSLHPGGSGAISQQVQSMLMQPDMRALTVMLALAGAALPTLWLIHRKWPPLWSRALAPGFGFAVPPRRWFFALATGIGAAAPLAGGWLTQLLAHGHTVPQVVNMLGTQASLGLRIPLALLVVGLGPIVEELLFRGVLLSALLQRLNAGWAIVASSLLFALVHLSELDFLWYALPYLFLLAAALAWLRLRSASIWPSVLAHAVNNLLAVATWFLLVKPV